MLIGHYSASYAGKAIAPRVRLWILFLAVQFLDVLWSIFVLLGIEKVRIVPGVTKTNPLDLYYMPWSHSLVAALFWAVLVGIIYRFVTRDRWGGTIVGIAVFSHWILDFIVHVKDLPIVGDRYKVGLGLWNYPVPALLLEIALLVAGLLLYLRLTRRRARGGTVGFIIYTALMVLAQVMTFFGSPPSTPVAAAIAALVIYIVFAAIAAWLERRREPVPVAPMP